jgi:hypothetical protein
MRTHRHRHRHGGCQFAHLFIRSFIPAAALLLLLLCCSSVSFWHTSTSLSAAVKGESMRMHACMLCYVCYVVML